MTFDVACLDWESHICGFNPNMAPQIIRWGWVVLSLSYMIHLVVV